MKTPLGAEVDLVTGRIVLDVVPAVRERGTAVPALFAHVCCGHGRPSQLLLSSCYQKVFAFCGLLIIPNNCVESRKLCDEIIMSR